MKIDKEISHPSHPKHKLKLEYTEIPFICDGCKEAGIGLKYKCVSASSSCCEFELHKTCALAPPIVNHPFYAQCEFRFYYRPPGSELRRCDGCSKLVHGFVYHCNRCGFDLHPCCANLPHVLVDDDDHKKFYTLCAKMTSGGRGCDRCGGVKGGGWAYKSQCKTYNVHVSCVKELLVESWEKSIYSNVDKIGPATLKGTLKKHNKKDNSTSSKVSKYCHIAGGAVRVIVSAILGDPAAVIGAVVGGLISN